MPWRPLSWGVSSAVLLEDFCHSQAQENDGEGLRVQEKTNAVLHSLGWLALDSPVQGFLCSGCSWVSDVSWLLFSGFPMYICPAAMLPSSGALPTWESRSNTSSHSGLLSQLGAQCFAGSVDVTHRKEGVSSSLLWNSGKEDQLESCKLRVSKESLEAYSRNPSQDGWKAGGWITCSKFPSQFFISRKIIFLIPIYKINLRKTLYLFINYICIIVIMCYLPYKTHIFQRMTLKLNRQTNLFFEVSVG